MAVRIPKSIANRAGIAAGDELRMDVVAHVIRLKPRRKSTLTDLLARISPQNVHAEAKFGRPERREAL